MTCSECTIARDNNNYTLFSPKCVYCGARLIKILGTLDKPKEEIKSRRLEVLDDWEKYGCSREEVRMLVKEKMPIEEKGK